MNVQKTNEIHELTTAELELVAGGVTMDEYIWDLAIIGGGLFDAGCVWASNRPVGVLGAGVARPLSAGEEG